MLKGDACLYKTWNKKCFEHIIQLCVIDKDFTEYFNDVLEQIFSRKVKILTQQRFTSLFYRVSLRSKPFYEWYNSKTEEELFEIAERNPAEFIKGVFDSEGSLTNFTAPGGYNYLCVRMVTSNLKLANLLQKWLSEYFGIYSTFKTRVSYPRMLEGRYCNFSKPVYLIGIYRKDDVRKFFKGIGTSIIRKSLHFKTSNGG